MFDILFEWIPYILPLAFIGMGYFSMKSYFNNKRLRKEWHYVRDAIIIKNIISRGKNRNTASPVVRFMVDGKTYESTSSVGQSPALRVGKTVGVYYDPDNPDDIIVDTFRQRGGLFYLLVAFSLSLA